MSLQFPYSSEWFRQFYRVIANVMLKWTFLGNALGAIALSVYWKNQTLEEAACRFGLLMELACLV
jgi:hypothetical protein